MILFRLLRWFTPRRFLRSPSCVWLTEVFLVIVVMSLGRDTMTKIRGTLISSHVENPASLMTNATPNVLHNV